MQLKTEQQQVTDKKESRVAAVNGVEKQANVKEKGKAERKSKTKGDER